MRVALSGWFWNQLDTGSGQYLRRLVAALMADDPTLELIVFTPSRDEGDAAAGTPPNLKLISRTPPRTRLGKVRWEQILVARWAHQVGADLLHIPYWAPPLTAPLPVIVTAHDIIPVILKPYRGGWHVRAYTTLVSAATRRAELVLTDSEASRHDILEHLHVAPDRVRAIPLAVGEAYVPTPSEQDAKLRGMLNVAPPYLLYLGGFDVRKNVATVLQAFSIVHQAYPDATLVIAGRLPSSDAPFNPDPRRLARAAHLDDDAVRFVGFVSEAQKLALLRGARAFVFPSAYEGFGYPPLEALACGIPVVASNASSLPEVVGDAGILLEPQDISGIAGALIQLLIDEPFHADLVERARLQSRRFSWQHTARETRQAYEKVSLSQDHTKSASKRTSRPTNNKIEV
jgi:glycosyltransferase involved in cell wall biosynthesis